MILILFGVITVAAVGCGSEDGDDPETSGGHGSAGEQPSYLVK
jgi:hypothetical protein